jgi:hypothetical protein
MHCTHIVLAQCAEHNSPYLHRSLNTAELPPQACSSGIRHSNCLELCIPHSLTPAQALTQPFLLCAPSVDPALCLLHTSCHAQHLPWEAPVITKWTPLGVLFYNLRATACNRLLCVPHRHSGCNDLHMQRHTIHYKGGCCQSQEASKLQRDTGQGHLHGGVCVLRARGLHCNLHGVC